MEFAFCAEAVRYRKPRQLMTPSKQEGVFFMVGYALVMLGGALGTGARFWMSGFVAERAGESLPFGTLLVNITGSFVIGLFAAFTDPEGEILVSPRSRQFFMIGVCGGYTTFSSFSLQTLDFIRDGDWLPMLLLMIAIGLDEQGRAMAVGDYAY
jgi:CrcB protein